MSALLGLIRGIAADRGVELDDEELASIGLDVEEAETPPPPPPPDDVLGQTLSGEAAGAVEIFLAAPSTAKVEAVEKDGFTWEPIIREGQWAVRPGAGGQKRRSPLKVVAGTSKNQRKEIGLQDIVAAFDDAAIEHVTVPLSHDNKVNENTGFIKKLKIVQGEVKDKATKKMKKVAVLIGAYDIREPEVKRQMQLGTIASRSAGLLYDYINTETGKTYPVALEHVALTNKPWITGMKAFGRKLVKLDQADTVALSLSDDEPQEAEILAQEDALETIQLADTSITWDKEDDPDWLRARVNCQLDEARAKKVTALKSTLPMGAMVDYYDYPPRYRCVKARPGLALIADGWGDEANCWTAPFAVTDGDVVLDPNLDAWTASKRVFIPDDARKQFEAGEEPLAQERIEKALADTRAELENLSPLQIARRMREQRGNKTAGVEPEKPIIHTKTENTTHPRGGEHMADENAATLQLSDEARRQIQAAEDRAKTVQEENTKLSQRLQALEGNAVITTADTNIAKLKADGFTEEAGFTGVLVEARNLMVADDGGAAAQSDSFADDDNKTGELTLSQAVMRLFKAFERTDDGKLKVGLALSQPSKETTEELGDDGKPPKSKTDKEALADGDLSQEDFEIKLAHDDPAELRSYGMTPEKVTALAEKYGERFNADGTLKEG